MNQRLYRYHQAFLLLGLALFLFNRFSTGKLFWYINARFVVLTFLAMIGLIVMAANVLAHLRRTRQREAHGDFEESGVVEASARWNLLLMALPLIFGLLIPTRPLDANAASNRGVSISAPIASGNSQPASLEAAPDERNVLDWIRIFNYETNLTPYLGQTANVIGFIYRDPRLPEGQFMVSRFAITCCVADAFAIGLVVDWPDTTSLPADGWVNVRGVVDILEMDGQKVPLIHAKSVTLVDPPSQPYLFP
jgi:uncharacterized repeat protein (TIGR03943 family)